MEYARTDTLRKEVEGFLASCMADNAATDDQLLAGVSATMDRCAQVSMCSPVSLSGCVLQRFLRSMPLCAELSDDDVAGLVGNGCYIEFFDARQEVCREGQRDHRMFIILSGTLIIEHKIPPSTSSSILSCSAPGPTSLGAGRSIELRTGEALGILSALAGRPKNSNVFAGPHGCQLGVVPAWALAPYMHKHVEEAVSKMQAPTQNTTPVLVRTDVREAFLSIPPPNPAIRSRVDCEDSLSTNTHTGTEHQAQLDGCGPEDEDNEVIGDTDDEVKAEIEDDLYLVLELLPRNRLTHFIDQVRRTAFKLCKKVLILWREYTERQRKVLTLCGFFLKKALADIFLRTKIVLMRGLHYQWQRSTAASRAQGMAEHFRNLLVELEREREKVKALEQEQEEYSKLVKLLQQEVVDERQWWENQQDHRMLEWKLVDHCHEQISASLQHCESTVEKLAAIMSEMEKNGLGQKTGIHAQRLKVPQATLKETRRPFFAHEPGVDGVDKVNESDLAESGTKIVARIKSDIKYLEKENGRAAVFANDVKVDQGSNISEKGQGKVTNPFATPEVGALPGNLSLSPGFDEERNGNGTAGIEIGVQGCDQVATDIAIDHCGDTFGKENRYGIPAKSHATDFDNLAPTLRKEAQLVDNNNLFHFRGSCGRDIARRSSNGAMQSSPLLRPCGSSELDHFNQRGLGCEAEALHMKSLEHRGQEQEDVTLSVASLPAVTPEPDNNPEVRTHSVVGSRVSGIHMNNKETKELPASAPVNTHATTAATPAQSTRNRRNLSLARRPSPRELQSSSSPSLSPVLRDSSSHSTPSIKSAGTCESLSPVFYSGKSFGVIARVGRGQQIGSVGESRPVKSEVTLGVQDGEEGRNMSIDGMRESEGGRGEVKAKGDDSLPEAAGTRWMNSSTGGLSSVLQGHRNSLCGDEAEVEVGPEFLLGDNTCLEGGWDEFATQDVENEAYAWGNNMRHDSVKAYAQSGYQSPALQPVLDNISASCTGPGIRVRSRYDFGPIPETQAHAERGSMTILASGDSDQICGRGEDKLWTEDRGNGCIWRSVNEAEMQRDGETATGLELEKDIKTCRQRGRTNVNFQLFYEKRMHEMPTARIEIEIPMAPADACSLPATPLVFNPHCERQSGAGEVPPFPWEHAHDQGKEQWPESNECQSFRDSTAEIEGGAMRRHDEDDGEEGRMRSRICVDKIFKNGTGMRPSIVGGSDPPCEEAEGNDFRNDAPSNHNHDNMRHNGAANNAFDCKLGRSKKVQLCELGGQHGRCAYGMEQHESKACISCFLESGTSECWVREEEPEVRESGKKAVKPPVIPPHALQFSQSAKMERGGIRGPTTSVKERAISKQGSKAGMQMSTGRQSQGGVGGFSEHEQFLREAPSTKASRLKHNANAPARERAEKDKRLRQEAETIARKLLSKGALPSNLPAATIAREALKCRAANQRNSGQ